MPLSLDHQAGRSDFEQRIVRLQARGGSIEESVDHPTPDEVGDIQLKIV
jgi:hypothetical protein